MQYDIDEASFNQKMALESPGLQDDSIAVEKYQVQVLDASHIL